MQRAKTMTAGLGRAALIGVIAGCLGAPGVVLGQSAPPPAKPKSPPAAATAPKPPPAATVPPVATNPFAALLGRPSDKLDPKQRAIIDKVNAYLTNTQMLSGKFVQVAPDGRRSQGQFFMSKPGKVRFEYDAPSPMDIVADGDSVVVRDRSLNTQDVYPLSQTPLRFLLADRVDLMRDTHLAAVYADDVFITAVVEERNGIIGTSRMMIMFSATDMSLKQWTITDPQGFDTTVAVYNLDSSRRPDPSLFRIDYTKYRN
jgi:outer membrane lipoprotein-sorting protein